MTVTSTTQPSYCDACGEPVATCPDKRCQARVESAPRHRMTSMHAVLLAAAFLGGGSVGFGGGGHRPDLPPRPPPKPRPKPVKACWPSEAELRRNRSTGGPVTEEMKQARAGKAQRRQSAKKRRGW